MLLDVYLKTLSFWKKNHLSSQSWLSIQKPRESKLLAGPQHWLSGKKKNQNLYGPKMALIECQNHYWYQTNIFFFHWKKANNLIIRLSSKTFSSLSLILSSILMKYLHVYINQAPTMTVILPYLKFKEERF